MSPFENEKSIRYKATADQDTDMKPFVFNLFI